MRRRSAERRNLRLLNVRVGGNVAVEPGQRVGDLIPRSSILCVNVGFRATAGIAVERAERDADGFRVLAVGPEEGGAARAAELARDALRRTKGAKRALAALQTEAPSRETGVGRERRSVRLAAHAAVAVRDVAELSLDLVPYRSAEASAGQRGLHVPLLLRSSISRIAAPGAPEGSLGTALATFKIGAFAVILDEQQRVLLCHRRDYDLWNLPGGRVESGESPWDAVL